MKDKVLFILAVFHLEMALAYPASPPQEGYVPTQEVAEKVARPILIYIYGQEEVSRESPFNVELKGEVWIVRGVVKEIPNVVHFGHPLEIWISKKTGQVLRLEEEK